MRFAFISEYKDVLPIKRVCQIMDASPRRYRAYCSRPRSRSQCKDWVVLVHLRGQFALWLGSYRRLRMTGELKEAGVDVGHRRVGRSPLIAASSDCRAADAQDAALIEHAREIVAATVKMPAADIDPKTPLANLGIDSLMTVELQMGLAVKFDVEFSTMQLMQSKGVASPASELMALLFEDMDVAAE